jgi:hypothetical protein
MIVLDFLEGINVGPSAPQGRLIYRRLLRSDCCREQEEDDDVGAAGKYRHF